jgi:sugar phosphate isomerase/epimerase
MDWCQFDHHDRCAAVMLPARFDSRAVKPQEAGDWTQMELRGIGIDINDQRVNGDLEVLRRELDYFQACAFDVIELTTSGLFFVFNGNLHMKRARAIEKVLQGYPFHYTLHLPDCLNLGSLSEWELEKRIFCSCTDFAGATILVYHTGQDYLDAASGDEGKRAMELETAALAEMADRAKSAGIMVTVENQNPRPGESQLLADRGIPRERLKEVHPGLFPDAIGRQIEEINSPNLGMTLDIGHLFLAVELTGQDFLSAVGNQAGLVKHLHVNDNFGKNPSPLRSRMEQTLYGQGDCHLPLGLGALPFRECFKLLGGYTGYVIFEIRPEYRGYLPESIRILKRTAGI